MISDGFSLRSEWMECKEWARRSLEDAYTSAEEFAKAESEYQTRKHSLALKMKDDGLAATLIQMLIKGHADISSALFRRNRAELLHKVDMKAIDVAIQQEREAFKEYQAAMGGDR